MDNTLELNEEVELDFMTQFYEADDTEDERDEARKDFYFAVYS